MISRQAEQSFFAETRRQVVIRTPRNACVKLDTAYLLRRIDSIEVESRPVVHVGQAGVLSQPCHVSGASLP